ncbi:MAG: GPO family capsid scaffolding protein [Caulobacter sp.]|nr:GPO family capsid scaffolding protein [Caulobacter sp.]
MAKSKFFRVAVEGATATDGRVIERSWIDDIVATYNRATYGARVNLEHIRGFSPEAPFNAYGDVLSVKAQDDIIEIAGKPQKRRALYAEVEPTDALIALSKAKQKIYTSIEVAPNFAATGKAGLVGLAVTDSPASLGTDILEFSATNAPLKAMFDSRKQDPTNVFSACQEVADFSFDEPTAETESVAGVLKSFFTSLGLGQPANDNTKPAEPKPVQAANDGAQFAALQGAMITLASTVDQAVKTSAAATAGLEKRFGELETKLNTTERPSGPARAPATGTAPFTAIDC